MKPDASSVDKISLIKAWSYLGHAFFIAVLWRLFDPEAMYMLLGFIVGLGVGAIALIINQRRCDANLR
ncbi:MAG: hypothetical protein AAGL17_26240, partial [Cyanobacteria bacterium J06576_12]